MNSLKPIVCTHCGKHVLKPIAPSSLAKGRGKFCSSTCYFAYQKENRVFNPKMAKCHPHRVHLALGMCDKCYNKYKYQKRRDKIIAYQKERYDSMTTDEKAKLQYKKMWYKRQSPIRVASIRYQAPMVECALLLGIEKCEICNSTSNLRIDHNHTTNKLRGRLCSKCNSALGFANDDPERLLQMVEYLKRKDIYDSPNIIVDLDAINSI